jgi:probable rRNA maturation factor
MPSLEFFNRQRKRRVDLRLFRRFAELAMTKVMERSGEHSLPEEIVVLLVSDARITRIHRDFMSINEPTDVITFQHGEIFISVDAAERQCGNFSGDPCRELWVYFVHGLLHLSGLEDLTEQGFEEMATMQEAIVSEVEEKMRSQGQKGQNKTSGECRNHPDFLPGVRSCLSVSPAVGRIT